MSDLHVGAVTRIVVEEAARLRLPAIIASRRQCDVDGGYLGWTQGELVHLVKRWSGGHTQVIRDHGGPGQGRGGDDGIASLEADLVAGFDSLHLDVCKLPRDQQLGALTVLLGLFGRDPNGVTVEVGAEHEDQQHNARLVQLALNNEVLPAYAVVGAGTHVHAERQIGAVNIDTLVSADIWLHERGIRSKIHNCDWLANRAHFVRHVDAYNLAPELAQGHGGSAKPRGDYSLGAYASEGTLMAFITGSDALTLGRRPPDERRDAVLRALVAMLGPRAAEPLEFRDFNWHDEQWSRGGPVGLMGPGTLGVLGEALREPVGRIHWAGTETAREWIGYMEGGIEAGQRAAQECSRRSGRRRTWRSARPSTPI